MCNLESFDYLSSCLKHRYHIAEHWLAWIDLVMGGICLCSLSHSWGFSENHWKTGTVGKSAMWNAKLFAKFVLAQVAEP